MKIKLAEALLRRKELQEKIDRMQHLRVSELFETKVKRKKVNENIDDIEASVSKVEFNQITKEYDYYSKALRKVDAVIQQTNWTVEVEVSEKDINNYSEN